MSVGVLKPIAASLLLGSILAGCASAPFQKDQTYKITILHTNDHHGRFWENTDGEYGLAARKALVDQIRKEVKQQGGYSLLLDGGDVNTGVPESDLQNAEPDFKGMNKVGYDAMAVGNHEFDKPLSVLKQQQSWADFPLLSANIYREGKRMFKPYEMFNLGGVKVAVVGFTTKDTAKMVDPDNIKGIDFLDPITEAKQIMPELRQKADVVIAATHMGHYADGKHGVNAPGDVEMARAVKGFDLIVGGHSQNPVCMKAENVTNEAYVPGADCKPDQQNGAWIVQAHEWGKYVGRADFEFKNGQMTLVKYTLLPVNLKKTVKGADGKDTKVTYATAITPDAGLKSFLQKYQDKGQAQLNVKVSHTDGLLLGDRALVRKQQTNLGTLTGMAMIERAQADFVVLNSGGIRDSIKAGDITYKDVLKVFPFGSTLVQVDMSGKEVMDYLNAAAKMTAGAGAFPQFAGVKLHIENGVVTSASIKGAAIDPAKKYRLATNSFMAAGGDGYPKLKEHPGYRDSGFVDAEVLKDFLAKKPVKIADFPIDFVTRK